MCRIDTFVERTGRWLHVSAQAVLVFMMVSISYDAIMRYAFSAPTVWSLEVNTFLLGYLALMPAAAVLRSGDQLHIVFFRERLGVATGVVVDIAVAAIGVIFCLVMTWRGSIMAWHAFLYDERMSTTLGTPMVLPFALVPLGFALLTLQFCLNLLGHVSAFRRNADHIREDAA